MLGMVIPNRAEVDLAFEDRRSATTAAITFVALVWEVALRFVCTPTGIMPITAIKQNAAIPSASVTSTKENPETARTVWSHLIDFNISAEAR